MNRAVKGTGGRFFFAYWPTMVSIILLCAIADLGAWIFGPFVFVAATLLIYAGFKDGLFESD